MFSFRQKQEIAHKIQQALRNTNHHELPEGEIKFIIHVCGKESWSFADIKNNGIYEKEVHGINQWNEKQDKRSNEKPALQPPQVERIKEKLKETAKKLRARVSEHSEVAKEMELEAPENKERYYHDGKADDAAGIMLEFECDYFEELQ